MRRKYGLLKMPFHIEARSDQCGKAMLTSLGRGVLPFRGGPWSAAQISVCCGGSPGSWLPRVLAGLGARPILPWRVGPGPWQTRYVLSWRAVARSQGLLMVEE